MRKPVLALSALVALLALPGPATAATAPTTIKEFPAGSKAMYIEPSPADNTLWITRQGIGVQQFSTAGAPLASNGTPAAADLAVDTDGTVYWTVNPPANPMFAGWARRSPAGRVTTEDGGNPENAYPIVLPGPGTTPIIGGHFPTSQSDCVYVAGTAEACGPANSRVTGLAFDGTGRVWGFAPEGHQAFRVPPSGGGGTADLTVTLPADTLPGRAARGPDGNLWIAGFGNSFTPAANTQNRIIRLTPQGVQTSFMLPPGTGPNDITLGPDGALWFTELEGNAIGRMTTAGAYTSFPVPSSGGHPYGITKGPDGNIWFTEFDGGRIGKLVPGGNLPAGKDTTKPKISSFALSRTRFRAAPSGASTSAKRKHKRKRAPVGTRVRFVVSEASSVRFTVKRKASGRRSGKKCAAPTHRNRGKRRCTRYKGVKGSFTVKGKAGTNRFTFRGRLRGRALKRGSYRLYAKATDPSKNASVPRLKGFTILR